MNAGLLNGQPASAFAPFTGGLAYIHNGSSPQMASFNVVGDGAIGGAFDLGAF